MRQILNKLISGQVTGGTVLSELVRVHGKKRGHMLFDKIIRALPRYEKEIKKYRSKQSPNKKITSYNEFVKVHGVPKTAEQKRMWQQYKSGKNPSISIVDNSNDYENYMKEVERNEHNFDIGNDNYNVFDDNYNNLDNDIIREQANEYDDYLREAQINERNIENIDIPILPDMKDSFIDHGKPAQDEILDYLDGIVDSQKKQNNNNNNKKKNKNKNKKKNNKMM